MISVYVVPVYPLGTILTIGMTSEDRDTCVKPIFSAISPTLRSCSSYLQ